MPTLNTHTHTDLSIMRRQNVDSINFMFLQSALHSPMTLFINLWEAE